MAFNKITKLRASDCTPESQREEIEITKIVDPVSKTEVWNVPEGYNMDEYDTCDVVVEPTISLNKKTSTDVDGTVTYTLNITVTEGSNDLKTYRILIDGVLMNSGAIENKNMVYTLDGTEESAVFEVIDSAGRTYSKSIDLS